MKMGWSDIFGISGEKRPHMPQYAKTKLFSQEERAHKKKSGKMQDPIKELR
jgi:hypothetical protein